VLSIWQPVTRHLPSLPQEKPLFSVILSSFSLYMLVDFLFGRAKLDASPPRVTY
jgi:hypothetical protein